MTQRPPPPGGDGGGLLPLDLTTFERYMLQDDRPGWPMNWFCRLRFTGGIDRSAFTAALKATVSRHPLLSALVTFDNGGPRWSACDAEPHVRWLPGHLVEGWPHASGIDLRVQPGLIAHVVERTGTTEVVLQFHHACCDGVGSLLFIRDLITLYSFSPSHLRRLEPRRLKHRGIPEIPLRLLPAFVWKQLKGFDHSLAALTRRPQPLAGGLLGKGSRELPAGYPAGLTVEFEADETARLRNGARRAGVSVSDVLSRDILLATGDWRARRGLGDENEWLRLVLPYNLRHRRDRALPACAKLSYLMLHSRRRDGADPARVLAGVQRHMKKVRECGLGVTALLWLRALQSVPPAFRMVLGADSCWATTVFTYIGTPLSLASAGVKRPDGRAVLGDLVLEGVDTLSTLRPNTTTAFSALRYAGRLNVTMQYDPRPLAESDAAELLDGFAFRVRHSIAELSRS